MLNKKQWISDKCNGASGWIRVPLGRDAGPRCPWDDAAWVPTCACAYVHADGLACASSISLLSVSFVFHFVYMLLKVKGIMVRQMKDERWWRWWWFRHSVSLNTKFSLAGYLVLCGIHCEANKKIKQKNSSVGFSIH